MPAKVVPLKHAERTFKQSRFEAMPRVPFRMLLTGRSAAGKSTTISSLILDHYRGVFEKIYIFSSTVHLDPTFQALVKYGELELGQGKTDDLQSSEFVFTTFDETAIHEIMDRSKASIEKQAKNKQTLKGSAIILDDLSHENGMRKQGGGTLARLFTTARHHGLTIIASTHSSTSLGPLARRQIDTLLIYPISNTREMQSLSEQYSRLASKDPKVFDEIYKYAAGPSSPPYPFLTVFVNSRNPNKTFLARFDEWIIPPEE